MAATYSAFLSSGSTSVISVSTNPGATTFAVIDRLPSSRATDRALPAVDLGEGRLARIRVRDVALDGEDPLGRLARTEGDRDVVARVGEGLRDRAPDAAVAAGDEHRSAHAGSSCPVTDAIADASGRRRRLLRRRLLLVLEPEAELEADLEVL